MLITRKWLEKSILLNENGSFQLSPKQVELLHSWFPELFKDGPGISFVKHWNREILGKEISDIRAGLFLAAKFEEGRNRKAVSEQVKSRIQAGLDFCLATYGKMPEHPHVRIVSLIGHIPGVDLIKVLFTPPPEEVTAVEFIFEDSESFKHLECVCGGLPMKDAEGNVFLKTILYSIEPPLHVNDEPIKKELKDCTGKEITACIDELRRKKKFVVKRKAEVLAAGAGNAKGAKAAGKKIGMPIQPQNDFETLYELFLKDFKKANERRGGEGLRELSLSEFAEIMSVDTSDPLSLKKYKPGKIDWEKTLKQT